MRAGWKAAVKALSPVPQDVLFMHAYRSPAVQRRARVPQKQIQPLMANARGSISSRWPQAHNGPLLARFWCQLCH